MEKTLNLIASIIANPNQIRNYRELAKLYNSKGKTEESSALLYLIENKFLKNDHHSDNNR